MNAKGAKDREGSQRSTREGWTAKIFFNIRLTGAVEGYDSPFTIYHSRIFEPPRPPSTPRKAKAETQRKGKVTESLNHLITNYDPRFPIPHSPFTDLRAAKVEDDVALAYDGHQTGAKCQLKLLPKFGN
jgi:hypothetical protein